MICVFIFMGRFFPGGGRAFFDKSMPVGFCRNGLCFMAATPFSRRFQQWNRAIALEEKETAALISQKPPCTNRRMKIPLLDDGFFSFAVVRQI